MLTFFAGLLAFGTLWFWLLSLVVFCIITALVENDEGVWATIVFLGTLVLLNFLSKIPILDFVKTNPGHTVLYVALYFVIGVAWTLVKWYFFVKGKSFKYNEYKSTFLKKRNTDVMTPELAAAFMKYLSDDYRAANVDKITGKAPDPREHKGSLTRWGTYWPFSMVGTALNDVIRKAWDYIYESLQTTYERMSQSIFKNASEDVKMAENYKAQQAAALADGAAKRSRF